jgi:hypothetical protein
MFCMTIEYPMKLTNLPVGQVFLRNHFFVFGTLFEGERIFPGDFFENANRGNMKSLKRICSFTLSMAKITSGFLKCFLYQTVLYFR